MGFNSAFKGLNLSKLGPYPTKEPWNLEIGQKYARKMTGDKEHAHIYDFSKLESETLVLVYAL